MNAPCIAFTDQETRLMEMLAVRWPDTATYDDIHRALYRDTEGPEWSKKIPSVHICHMRKKLPAGHEIQSVYGNGYRLVYRA